MSEEEKYAAQGRAHARAKELKSEIATLRVEAMSVQKALSATVSRMDGAIHDPLLDEPQTRVAAAIQLVHDLRFPPGNALLSSASNILDELYVKSKELDELEKQIAQF